MNYTRCFFFTGKLEFLLLKIKGTKLPTAISRVAVNDFSKVKIFI